MQPPPKAEFPRSILEMLRSLLPADTVQLENNRTPEPVFFRVRIGDFRFTAISRSNSNAADINAAIRQAATLPETDPKSLPLVVVPFMGSSGSTLCAESAISWIDLSGNASISAGSSLRIHIEGKPNRFKTKGRPRNLFAPKSSRISRCLLASPERSFTQRELAETCDLDEGFTSRVVHGLAEKELIHRDSSGAVCASDPKLLLNAWREAYDFDRHHIRKGHVPVRTGTELLKKSADVFRRHSLRYAVTGLAGAWLIDPTTGFRLVTIYLAEEPDAELFSALSFREDPTGANLWLVRPKDEGVFFGAKSLNGIQCVLPVQVYLDLKNQPERAAEAAEAIKPKLFTPEPTHG